MIQPNFNILLWMLTIIIAVQSIKGLIQGAREEKKETHYGITDILTGVWWILTIVLMLIFGN